MITSIAQGKANLPLESGVLYLLSIDWQNDFCTDGGLAYHPRNYHLFIRNDLVENLRKQNLKIAEIISDHQNYLTLVQPSTSPKNK